MEIKINGEPHQIEKDATIEMLLKNNGVESPELVTVQLNGEFIDSESFSTKKVEENDEFEFLYFVGGGV